MRSNYFIGVCIVLASVIFGAKDIYSLIQNENVIGTANGPVRLGQVNTEAALVKFVVFSKGTHVFEFEGTPSEIVGLVKNKMSKELPNLDIIFQGLGMKAITDSVTYNRDFQLQLSSKIIYSSQYQPAFTLNLQDYNKTYPKNNMFTWGMLVLELEKYVSEVEEKSKSLSFM